MRVHQDLLVFTGHRPAVQDACEFLSLVNSTALSSARWGICVAVTALHLIASVSAGDDRIQRSDNSRSDYHAKFAIIVGIDDYSKGEGLGQLQNAGNDAREFRKLLVDEFGYDDAHVLYLTDSRDEPKGIVDGQPTWEAIRSALSEWLPSWKPRPADSILFFFAGHGLREGEAGETYIAGSDSRAKDMKGTCVPVSWVREHLGDKSWAPCRHKLVLLDCCFSGVLFRLFSQPLAASLSARGGPGQQARENNLGARSSPALRGPDAESRRDAGEVSYYLSGDAYVGMTAGLGDQPVADGTGKELHSIFTRELLKKMRERANSRRYNHAFTFGELTALVVPAVSADTQGTQIPMAGRITAGAGDFLFQQTIDVEVPWEREERASRAVKARRLAALSSAERNTRLDRSLLLAVEAIRADETTFEARQNLYQALQDRPRIRSFLHMNEGAVQRVAISPNGRTLAAAYGGGFKKVDEAPVGGVVLWDVTERKRLTNNPLILDSGSVSGVAFSPDAKTMAVGFSDVNGRIGGVVLWDTTTQKRLGERPLALHEGDYVTSTTFSPDGKTLAAGYSSRAGSSGVVFWDVARSQRLPSGSFSVREGSVTSVSYSHHNPSAQFLAAGYNVGTDRGGGGVVLWNLATGQRLAETPLPVRESRVTCVSFSPDGRTLAAGYGMEPLDTHRSGGVVLWDVLRQERLANTPLAVSEGHVESVAFGPDGKTLAAGYTALTGGGGLVLWDAVEHERLADTPCALAEGDVRSVVYSPDGKTLATGYGAANGSAGGVVLMDVVARQRLTVADLSLNGARVTDVAYHPDGKTIAVGYGSRPGGVLLWDGSATRRFAVIPPAVAAGSVECVRYSPDGKILAAGFMGDNWHSGGVVLWDSGQNQRKQFELLPVTEGVVTCIAFSPNSNMLAASYMVDPSSPVFGGGGAVLWDVAERRRATQVPIKAKSGIPDIVFAADGKTLAGISSTPQNLMGEVILWDLGQARMGANSFARQGTGLMALKGIAFTPSGTSLATGYGQPVRGYGGVTIWDLAQHGTVRQKDLPAGVMVVSLAFSPDNKTLAAGAHHGVVLWDLFRMQRVGNTPLPLTPEDIFVRGVAFSPDSKRLAAGFGPNVVDGRSGKVVLLDLSLEFWQRQAGQIASRNFSQDEWREYFADEPYHLTFHNFSVPTDAAPSQIQPRG